MYLCADCGEIFDTPKIYIEKHGLEYPPYETWYGCPYCSGAYVETLRCDVCGEYIIEKYIKLINGDIICDRCYEEKNIFDEE